MGSRRSGNPGRMEAWLPIALGLVSGAKERGQAEARRGRGPGGIRGHVPGFVPRVAPPSLLPFWNLLPGEGGC